MHLSVSHLRSAARACALAAALALVPAGAAQAQDCLLPGSEEYQTEPICNMQPMVDVSPAGMNVSQPVVPVTIVASDHYSGHNFSSFRIMLSDTNVTPQWNVKVTEGGWGTGRMKTFTANGSITLTEALAERTLLVELCDVDYCSPVTAVYRLMRPGVEVTQDGASGAVPPAATRTTTFSVKNTGIATATFAVTAECRDAAGQPLTPCSVSPAGVTLGKAVSSTVTATYPATQEGGMVTITVRARQTDAPGVQDAGWTDMTIRSMTGSAEPAPQVALVPLNAGANVERSQCVTAAAGPRGAYECGDMRVAHALPAATTRGRTWSPTLIFNSQHANPRPIVYADVTVPSGALTPSSVEMVVTMAGGAVHRAVFSGTDFLPGMARRIGVQWDALQTVTGVYGYTVQVISHYPGGQKPSPVYTGELVIVNRSDSYLGSGWWLAGLERLFCLNCSTGGSRTLWVGGDGSTRVYEPASPGSWTYWVAQNPDGAPDTLVLNGSEYHRKLPGGGKVYYDAAGLHARTVNRLGQTTLFTYGSHGLAAIYAPGSGPGGPGTGDPAWTLNWDNTAHVVRSITATAQGAPSRTTALTIEAAANRVTNIIDPDSLDVRFGYSAAQPRFIDRIRDRRGTYTFYGYDAALKLVAARTQLGASANAAVDPTVKFTAAESRGVAFDTATAGKSASAAQAYTRIDGPRTDVNDYTTLWLSPTGVVRRVRDALGAETYLQFDPRFPALPTQVSTSTGRVTRAHYDNRGRVDTATVVNVFDDGRDHVTTYAYDNRWDAPTAVTSYQVYPGGSWTPLAGTARTEYDTLNGNVRWRQQGDDQARRVTFSYYASGAAAGQLASVRAPSGVPGQTARDSLLYDARGNLRVAVSPLGFLSLVYRDGLGRDTLSVTPTTAAGAVTEAGLLASGVRRRTTYDVMDQVRKTVTIGPAMQHVAAGGAIPLTTGSDTLVVMTEPDAEGLPLQVLRWASPDTARVHILTTTYTYDRAGRKETESDGVVLQRFAYDPAGNVRTWTTPRNYQVTSQYDALNRLTRRTVPAVTYARSCPSGTSPCAMPFPYFPSDSSGALVIPEEQTAFRFDSAGNMVYAENADAVIRRGYYKNGALRTDSIAIRSLVGSDFNTYRYGITYGYTLAGSVSSMQQPTNLTGSQTWDQFGYDPVTGALGSMVDRNGHYFEFHRNYAGQLTSLRGPAYTDSMRYDLEGRLVDRVETALYAGLLHDDSLMYDGRGKLMQVNVGATNGRGGSTYRQWYSGSGMLIGTDWRNEMDAGQMQEAFGMDAMGNIAWRVPGDGSPAQQDSVWRYGYDGGLGRLVNIKKLNLGPPSLDFQPDETGREYDASGNLQWGTYAQAGDLGNGTYGVRRDKRSRSWYGADERLRFFQEHDLRGGTTVKQDGVWEEYRYDPMGRRVLVNTRTKGLCNTQNAFQCASATTRMVWAGDQLLWEIRGSSDSPGETAGPSDAYGTVGYTHAEGIDRPLVITKNGQSVLPHQNWRGQFSRGTFANGTSSDCVGSQTNGCYKVAWPGWRTTAWHVDAKDPDIRTWWGGLVDGMRDVSGQLYMRNRYYDPATGQFTQSDPIGIAGGLNTYGYAAGDPVSYHDPFGLNPCLVPPITAACVQGVVIAGAATLAVLTVARVELTDVAEAVGNGVATGTTWAVDRGREWLSTTLERRGRRSGEDSAEDEERRRGHRRGARRSTRERHQRGDERRGRDQGGERGDERRPYRRSGKRSGDQSSLNTPVQTPDGRFGTFSTHRNPLDGTIVLVRLMG